MQGVWLNWEQGVFPFDLSWDNLILGPGSRIVSFVLNATHNSVMTPDLRHICGYVQEPICQLCQVCGKGRQANLHHILAGCQARFCACNTASGHSTDPAEAQFETTYMRPYS